MKIHRFLPLIVAILFISACATLTKDIEVQSETASGIDLTKYKSFAWVASAEIINDPHGNWEPNNFDADAEIRFLLLKELREQGLVETNTNPDLFLVYAAGVNMENFDIVYDPDSKMSTLTDAPKAALLVVMIDPATRHPVWVGAARGDAKSGRSHEDIRKRIAFAVNKMFANWGNPAK